MKAVFLCCAELGIVDQQTRRVSAINILSNHNAKSFPVLHPKMAIVGIVQKEEGDAQQNEVILQGFFDGQEMFKSTMNLSFNLSTSLETASLLVDVNGVVVPKPGTMTDRSRQARRFGWHGCSASWLTICSSAGSFRAGGRA